MARRSASLATGFALSAGPVSAQTITTDTNGLTATVVSRYLALLADK